MQAWNPQAMIESAATLVINLVLAFYHAGYAISHPGAWLDWSDKEALMRFVYYGASFEFLFVFLAAFLSLTAIGLWKRSVMWGSVWLFEFIGNWVGRIFAWAGIVMVVQQVMIVFLQRIFRVAEVSVGPFGYAFTRDLAWFGEELKLYNAMVVCLCCGYTFIQGGHVRVDLLLCGRFASRQEDRGHGRIDFLHAAVLVFHLAVFLVLHVAAPHSSQAVRF